MRSGFWPVLAAVTACGNDARVLIEDFDGRGPGRWSRMEPRSADFEFEATDDSLVMRDQAGLNQHLVRDGVAIDSRRPYFIEADFVILGPVVGGSNSFAIEFNVAGDEGDTSPVSCMALNLDIDADGEGGEIKTMGFVDGGFQRIDTREVAWARPDTPYTYQIEVNRDLSGTFAANVVSAAISSDGVLLEELEQDYAEYPYQVPSDAPHVRFGLNTHGTDWRVTRLTVGYSD